MYTNILPVLRCPHCGAEFELAESRNEDEDHAAIDLAIDAIQSEHQRKLQKDFLDGIVAETLKLKTGFLLDIASGRGTLLRELQKNVNAAVDIISVDLSFHVLRQDRLILDNARICPFAKRPRNWLALSRYRLRQVKSLASINSRKAIPRLK